LEFEVGYFGNGSLKRPKSPFHGLERNIEKLAHVRPF